MIGTVLINRYEILEKIGIGGMAVVYKAKDTLLGRLVAVKILHEQFAQDETFVRHFRREAQSGAGLSHPNIVSIFDVGRHHDDHFLVMEYVEGTNLKDIIKKFGPLEEDQVLRMGIELCDALEHAHENGLIHCDIKPHNILVTDKGKVKVTDFGIARACTSDTITFTGSMVGSVHYFSPEQARGGKADIQSDLYSASVVLYELATGQVPFTAESPVSVALKQISDEPVPPTQINPEISPELEQVILKGMSKSPKDRYGSAGEMKQALRAVGNGDLDSSPVATESTPVVKKKLRPVTWVALALGLFLIMAVGYFSALGVFRVEDVEVPNVVNEEVAAATDTLEEAGLEVNVLSELYSTEIPKGHVISQNPKGGEKVKKNRVVTLEVSKGAEILEIPDVVGQSLRDAQVSLESLGFKVAEDISYVYDSDVGQGKVIQQFPKAQTKEELGAEVSLVVSRGPQPRYISMPDLRGMTLDEAKKKLEEARLGVGDVGNVQSEFYSSGQVADQSAAPASSILQGQKVNLVVSKGPGPGVQYAVVNVAVPDDGEKHRIRIEVVDSRGTHEEYNNLHDPGDKLRERIPFYGSGTVNVYRDGQLIEEKSVK